MCCGYCGLITFTKDVVSTTLGSGSFIQYELRCFVQIVSVPEKQNMITGCVKAAAQCEILCLQGVR